MMQLNDLHWAAGFLEGEGSFGACGGPSGQAGQIRITCHQTIMEPLERLRVIFGGHVMGPHRGPRRPIYLWSLQYRAAVGAMMTLYPLMSDKRKTQIKTALDYWKSFLPHRRYWGRCLHGHVLMKGSDGKRRCRTCNARRQREYRKRKYDATT